jgi:small subunit ribosomal protein S15
MGLSDALKQDVVASHRRHEKDTGSAEVQVGLLTARILQLTEHMKSHKKDQSSRRGLLKMVGRRSALLKYLSGSNHERYVALINKLGLRK